VVKRFSVRELLAEWMAVLRRSPERPADVDHGEAAVTAWPIWPARGAFRGRRAAGVIRTRGGAAEVIWRAIPGGLSRGREISARVWRLDPKGVEDAHDRHARGAAAPRSCATTRRVRGFC
jgi:DNA-binding response OmpR family regulator